MAINFPDNPTLGQVHSTTTASWTFNGVFWAPTPFGTGETRLTHTVTNGQTVIGVNFMPGALRVFRNGVKQNIPADVYANNGTAIAFYKPLQATDLVETEAAGVISTLDALRRDQNLADLIDTAVARVNMGLVGSMLGHGQCRFVYVNTTTLRLRPLNGNRLVINGVSRQIPDAGVDITNAAWTNGVHRYVYAYWTGTAIALEASATGHSMDATTGVEIKTGDPTRTLVGMATTTSGNQFFDAPTSRLVASWFNRRRRILRNTSIVSFSATAFTNISSNYLTFLAWADSNFSTVFTVAVDVPDSHTANMGIALDGTIHAYTMSYVQNAAGNWFDTLTAAFDVEGLSETVAHYSGVSGAVTGGTAAIIGSPTHTGSVDI